MDEDPPVNIRIIVPVRSDRPSVSPMLKDKKINSCSSSQSVQDLPSLKVTKQDNRRAYHLLKMV